jgi:peptide/nickel transport system substrate-binding protein
MNRITIRRIAAGVAAAALVVTGLSATTTTASAATRSLVIGLSSDPAPTTYDPVAYAAGQRLFYESLYDSLFYPDGKGGENPGLASSYTVGADKKSIVLNLRSGVKFSDGSTLNGDTVKANLDRAIKATKDDNLASYQIFEKGGSSEITSVTASGNTATVNFAKAQGEIPSLFTGVAGMIVSSAAAANPASLKAAPAGSGPYVLTSAGTIKGSSYKETKNAGHWRAASYQATSLLYRVYNNGQAGANALATGQVDVLDSVGSAQVAFLTKFHVGINQMGGHVFWLNFWNGGQNPPGHATAGDKNVRLALSYATDRAALVKQLFPGDRPTASFIPKGQSGYDASLESTYAYSPTKAKQLLAAAGVSKLVLNTIIGPGDVAYAQALAAQWAKVGVTLNAKVFSSIDELFGAVGSEPFGLFDSTLANPAGFAAGVLVYGFGNFLGTTNPAVNGSLGAALGNPSNATLKALNDALVNEAWVIPIREGYAYSGYNAKTVKQPVIGVDGTEKPMLTDIQFK